jgi:hypothetical protein
MESILAQRPIASFSSLLGSCPTMVPHFLQTMGFQQSPLSKRVGLWTNSLLRHSGHLGIKASLPQLSARGVGFLGFWASHLGVFNGVKCGFLINGRFFIAFDHARRKYRRRAGMKSVGFSELQGSL